VLSNALELPSQIGFVILLSVMTELLLNSTSGYRTQSFGLIHQVTQTSATMLAISSAIYGSTTNSTDYQAKFAGIAYLILTWPLLVILANVLWMWNQRRKFRSLPEDIPLTNAKASAQDNSFSKNPLVAPSQSPASVSMEHPAIEQGS
jgi:hypothetical protein